VDDENFAGSFKRRKKSFIDELAEGGDGMLIGIGVGMKNVKIRVLRFGAFEKRLGKL
jgi:hypothetical protein